MAAALRLSSVPSNVKRKRRSFFLTRFVSLSPSSKRHFIKRKKKDNFICCMCWILRRETFAHNQSQLLYIFLIHGEKHSAPSLTQSDLGAESLFLRQYYRYYFSRKLWLFSMGWSDSHFWPYCAHNLAACRIYIVFLPFLPSLALSSHIVLQAALRSLQPFPYSFSSAPSLRYLSRLHFLAPWYSLSQ